jgi:DNA-binding response OmpR family regulator
MILVWDDEIDILELLSYNLQQAGFEVIAAEDEESFISHIRGSSPRIIILGATANHADQARIYRDLTQADETQDARIVCLASQDQEQALTFSSERQHQDICIRIPVRPSSLVRTIREMYQQDAVG